LIPPVGPPIPVIVGRALVPPHENNGTRYRSTSLYARDRDSKNMLPYNEFAYKKINNHCKLEDRF